MYIKNIDKNLYETDSMAALSVTDDSLRREFRRFAGQRLTKVKNADKYAKLLSGYYEKQLAKVRRELENEQEKRTEELQRENRRFEKIAEQYRDLLWKREKYRMEKYGFEWTNTGWVNIDNGTLPKPWASYPLEVMVENGGDFDRVHTYVVYTSIKSLYRLNTDDNVKHYAGNSENSETLMPKQETAVAIAIGYKKNGAYLATKEFGTGVETAFSLTLSASTPEKIKATIAAYEKYRAENRISEDLAFMEKMFEEKQRQKALLKKAEFIQELRVVAFNCCFKSKGERLFANNCQSCHSTGNDVVVGPGLAQATSKYPMSWIYKWVRNSSAVIASGDSDANRIFIQYNMVQMQSFPDLTNEDIRAIFTYIDDLNAKK
jgi:hypothetical protein